MGDWRTGLGGRVQGSTVSHFRCEICIKVPFLYDPFDLNGRSATDIKIVSASLSYLEEPLQPPHLEDTLSYQNSQLEDRPPFDPCICALRSIPMCPFPHHYV